MTNIAEEHFYATSCLFNAPQDVIFTWHTHPQAFKRLCPPWYSLEYREVPDRIENNARFRLKLKKTLFDVVFSGVIRPKQYVERITHPLYPLEHTSHFVQQKLEEKVRFHCSTKIVSELDRIFTYRHEVAQKDIAYHRRYSQDPLKIVVSGASGFIGSVLVPFLEAGGHRVTILTRNDQDRRNNAVFWDPEKGILDPEKIEGHDACINLAGENITTGLWWTRKKKERMRNSRIVSTRLLVDTIGKLQQKPSVFVSASAIGIYGDTEDGICDETAPTGKGFLANLTNDWEEEARAATAHGVRVVLPRIGVVLSPAGGMLQAYLGLAQWLLHGRIGSGKQWLSWIAIDDLVTLLHWVIVSPKICGPINAVSPNPIQQKDFTHLLSKVLDQSQGFPVPACALRLALQEKGEMLLASCKASAAFAEEMGFSFRYPSLEGALRFLLGKRV